MLRLRYIKILVVILLVNTRFASSTIYYVNNTYTAADMYTSATGSDAVGKGLAPSTPAATLTWVLSTYSASFASGDIIYIDDGAYSDKDLSSPANGVIIQGAGMSKTIFTNPGSDNYFMRIDDNNTVLRDMKLSKYDDMGGGNGQTIGVAANITGVQILYVQINSGVQTSTASGWPIEVASGATVTFVGGGTSCNNYDAGGGIRVSGSSSIVSITDYLFSGNQGIFNDGTALKIVHGTVTLVRCKFENSVADGNNHNGADIHMVNGTVKVYDSFFNASYSDYTSGGTMIGGSVKISGGTFSITRSKFTNHTTGGGCRGAAIGVLGGTVSIDSCNFSGNTANKANDVHCDGGTINARYCVWSEIGQTGGTFTIANSGNPTVFEGTVTKTNTTTSTYTANPSNLPSATGACGAAGTITTTFIILPVELKRFEGFCDNDQTVITWQTSAERNNHYFYIQKSKDGLNFETIGLVNGSDNSTSIVNYNFIDSEKNNENTYYKLIQEDYDGKQSESQIILVEASCANDNLIETTIYPNPTNADFWIDLTLVKASNVLINVTNSLGEIIYQNQTNYDLGFQTIQINTDNLNNGLYFVSVKINNKLKTYKLIKQ